MELCSILQDLGPPGKEVILQLRTGRFIEKMRLYGDRQKENTISGALFAFMATDVMRLQRSLTSFPEMVFLHHLHFQYGGIPVEEVTIDLCN